MAEKTKKLESLDGNLARRARELRQMGTGEEPNERYQRKQEEQAESVDTPGSAAYIRRRDKQAAEDLKNAPRRGK